MKKIALAALAITAVTLSSCDTNRSHTSETTTQTDRSTTISQGPGGVDDTDTMETSMPRDTGSVQGIDIKTFMTEAAEGGMAEVLHGKQAVEKASNAEVKKFGEKMIADHAKANNELKTLAKAKNITLPANTSPDHQQVFDRLYKLSGAEFDREYMSHMVADHEKTVNLFRSASQELQDNEVKAYAAKHLPHIQSHLEMARDINNRVAAKK